MFVKQFILSFVFYSQNKTLTNILKHKILKTVFIFMSHQNTFSTPLPPQKKTKKNPLKHIIKSSD